MFGATLAFYLYVQMPDCKRWNWSVDVYNIKVVCLEWRKKEPDKKK